MIDRLSRFARFGLGVLALTAAHGCAPKESTDTEAAPIVSVKLTKAVLADVPDTVPVDGHFEPPQGGLVHVGSPVQGRIVKVLVKEGDHVAKGQLMALVDPSVVQAESVSAALGARAAQVQAAQSDADLASAKADLDSTLSQAKLGVELAETERDSSIRAATIELQKLLNGSRPEEIAQAKQAVNEAQVERDRAKRDADRDRQLLAEGYVSRQQADASQASYEIAEAALEQALQQYTLVKKGPRDEDVKAAQEALATAREVGNKKVAVAKAVLDQARQGQLAVRAKEKEAAAAHITAQQRQADSQAASAGAGFTEIRATVSGTVIRRGGSEGDITDPQIPVLFDVAKDGSGVDFVGTLTPGMASRVSAGMPVIFPGFEGRCEISLVGAPSPQTGLISLRTSGPPGAKPGLFLTARIVKQTLNSVVAVPSSCVVDRDGKPIVFVVQNGVARLREIHAGPEFNGRTAVIDGVKPGEQVVLLGQHELSDGTEVEEKKDEAQ